MKIELKIKLIKIMAKTNYKNRSRKSIELMFAEEYKKMLSEAIKRGIREARRKKKK